MATMKKAVKKSEKRAAKVIDRFGPTKDLKIAPAVEKSTVKIKIGVESEDLQALTAAADRMAGAAATLEAAAKVVSDNEDPNVKQLHRRVVVAVYDAAGVRISNASHDLAEGDTLNASVTASGVSCVVASSGR